jgi:hypothetical protein
MTQHVQVGGPQATNAGPCPNCHSKATVLVGGSKHCNQCRLDWDQPRAIGRPHVIAPGTREHYQEPGILIEQQALADKETKQ